MAVPRQERPAGALALPARAQFAIPANKDVGATALPPELGASAPPPPQSPADEKCRVPADDACVYFCGNSLGALPIRSEELVMEELRVWRTRSVLARTREPCSPMTNAPPRSYPTVRSRATLTTPTDGSG
jgi:hypothetical protein